MPQFGYGLDAVHDGGVVSAAEGFSDGGQAEAGQVFCQAHGHLARSRDVAGTFFAQQLADFDPVVFGYRIEDEFGGNDFVGAGDNILQRFGSQVDVDWFFFESGCWLRPV